MKAEDKQKQTTPKGAPNRVSTKKRKLAMLAALEKTLGIVTTAAKAAGIDRNQHYKWMDEDPEYKAKVNEVKEITLDFVEDALLRNIKAGDTPAIKFHLGTQGRSRGYTSETQHNVKVQPAQGLDTSQLSESALDKILEIIDSEKNASNRD